MDKTRTGGVVLAGGKSSRMGRNKALMEFRGRSMVGHMAALLRDAGCTEIYVSGDVPGYAGIHDVMPYAGPACAIRDLLRRFQGRHARLLFVPVDMPLLSPDALGSLLAREGSSHYRGYPLPACVSTAVELGDLMSVKEILASVNAGAIDLTSEREAEMANVNTPAEWDRVAS
jgi:molybdopterin-guanine dinucleotide biosynthesis protein A